MKNQVLFIGIAFLATGCASLKPAGSTVPEKKDPQKKSSVDFIDGISMTPGSAAGVATNYPVGSSHPDLAASSTNIYGSTIEHYNTVQFKYAILLDAPVESMNNTDLLNFVEEWYGTKYHYGGTSKEGIDCSAFVSSLMSSVYHIYNLPRISKDQYLATRRISKDALQEGDLVFFHTQGKRKTISHVGVYLRNGRFVHASVSGVMISDLSEGYYLNHYSGAGRVVASPNDQ